MPRKEKTAGEKFARHMAGEFTKALRHMGLKQHQFYRQNATIVSHVTLRRMFNGTSGANCCLVADVADKLGLELKLVPKEVTEPSKDTANENQD